MEGINGATGTKCLGGAVEADVTEFSCFFHADVYNLIISIDVHFLDVAYRVL